MKGTKQISRSIIARSCHAKKSKKIGIRARLSKKVRKRPRFRPNPQASLKQIERHARNKSTQPLAVRLFASRAKSDPVVSREEQDWLLGKIGEIKDIALGAVRPGLEANFREFLNFKAGSMVRERDRFAQGAPKTGIVDAHFTALAELVADSLGHLEAGQTEASVGHFMIESLDRQHGKFLEEVFPTLRGADVELKIVKRLQTLEKVSLAVSDHLQATLGKAHPSIKELESHCSILEGVFNEFIQWSNVNRHLKSEQIHLEIHELNNMLQVYPAYEQILARLRNNESIENLLPEISGPPDSRYKLTGMVDSALFAAAPQPKSRPKLTMRIPDALKDWKPVRRNAQLALRKAIYNLISNAVKYGGKEITVTAEIQGMQILIAVEDKGIGMGHDMVLGYRQPVRMRDENARASGLPGSGSGHVVLLSHLRQAGASYFLISSAPDQGSRFAFSIPLSLNKTPSSSVWNAGSAQYAELTVTQPSQYHHLFSPNGGNPLFFDKDQPRVTPS